MPFFFLFAGIATKELKTNITGADDTVRSYRVGKRFPHSLNRFRPCFTQTALDKGKP